jgi:Cytochrome c
MRWPALVAAAAAFALGCDDAPRAYDLDGGDLVHAGAAYVAQRGCPTCHDPNDGSHAGGTLTGRTQPLGGTTAFPANLTPDRATGLGRWADLQIVRAIRYGVDDEGAELCPSMPRFSGMGDVEVRAIVAYLRSLPAVSREVPESMCPPVKPPPPPDLAMPPAMP